MTLAVAVAAEPTRSRGSETSDLTDRFRTALQDVYNELRTDQRRGEFDVLRVATDPVVTGPPYRVNLTIQPDVYRRYFACIDLFADTIAHKVNALISDIGERIEKIEISPAIQDPVDDEVNAIWGGGKFRIFLSYASMDRNKASPLAEGLTEFGAKVFMAHDDIPQGADWYSRLELALETMDCMVACIGPNYDASPTCNQEYGWARGREVEVVTIAPKGSVPPGIMGKYQAIEVSTYQDSISAVAESLIPGCTTATQYKDAAKYVSELRWEADWGNFRGAEGCVNGMMKHVTFLTKSQAREIVNIFNDDSRRGWGCNQVRYANGNQPNSRNKTPERLISWLEDMTGMVYEYRLVDGPAVDGPSQAGNFNLVLKRE